MSITLPTSIPTSVISGRWVDPSATGQSLVVLPSVTLAAGAEWYLAGGTVSGSLTTLVASDWSGPVSKSDGSGNPVLVFTVNKIAGTQVDRYTQYYYAVGQRDPANPGTSYVRSLASAGAYPTRGWNAGTIIVSTVSRSQSDLSSANYTLNWNSVSGVDFSKTYLVQRALGTSTPPMVSSAGSGAYHAQGTTEANAYSVNGITGFYTYRETTDTSCPLEILNDNKAQWTWFRVMAYSPLFGYTGVIQPGGTVTAWTGVPNDSAMYKVLASDGAVVVGEPTSTTDTTAAAISDPVSATNLPIETNLPMLKNGIGGVSHMRNSADLVHLPVRWREGMLVLNADQTVSKSHTTKRWGFRFHYNPSTWSQSSAIAQDIDLTTYSQTGGNLMLPTAFSTVDFTVYLNRIIELSQDVPSDDPQGTARRAKQLGSDDFYMGSGDGAPMASINPVDPGIVNSIDPAARATTVVGTAVADKITEVLRKGTLADIEYLYRACNGDPVSVSHTDGKTSDIGMLAMTVLDLYLGPDIRYTVRVASASIQHMMFSNRMIPIFSQVQLSLIRGITMSDVSAASVGTITNSTWTKS